MLKVGAPQGNQAEIGREQQSGKDESAYRGQKIGRQSCTAELDSAFQKARADIFHRVTCPFAIITTFRVLTLLQHCVPETIEPALLTMVRMVLYVDEFASQLARVRARTPKQWRIAG